MKIYRCIEEFEEIKQLSKQERTTVINAYKKEYHFPLFFVKIGFIILIVLLSEYLKLLPLIYRVAIYTIAGYWFSVLVDIVELNFIRRKAIIDLSRDILESRIQ